MAGARTRPDPSPSGRKIEHVLFVPCCRPVHSRHSGNPWPTSFRFLDPRFRPSRSALWRTRTRRSSRSERRPGPGDERTKDDFYQRTDVLKPGAIIGILGGGQLARMLALAAAPLGLRCHVFSPEKDSCAFDVVHAGTHAAYDDENALARFAGAVDVITYEFESVPAKTAAFLAQRKPVLPDPQVLETTQDRLIEKNFISGLKIPTAPYAPVHSATQLAEAVKAVGLPAVLKTRQLGYDGKGQAKIAKGGDAIAAWQSVKNAPA